MAYTRKELEKMSIKQLKMIENELSRKPSGNFRSDTSNIETISKIFAIKIDFVFIALFGCICKSKIFFINLDLLLLKSFIVC